MSTPVIERQNVFTDYDPQFAHRLEDALKEDLSKKAHFVTPAENWETYVRGCAMLGHEITTKELVDFARWHHLELVALCQYRWVPTEQVGNHDTCMACLAVAQNRLSEEG